MTTTAKTVACTMVPLDRPDAFALADSLRSDDKRATRQPTPYMCPACSDRVRKVWHVGMSRERL